MRPTGCVSVIRLRRLASGFECSPDMREQPTHCERCPDCDSPDVEATVKTVRSSYCRCRACGSVWHEERTDPRPDHPLKRRKSDR
jgi:hypothetical protein